MPLKNFHIFLDKCSKTYSPKEIVKGHVDLVLNSPTKCRGIWIEIDGEAKTSWNNWNGGQSTKCTGHEDYFHKKLHLFGENNRDEKLESGFHTFEFQFTLPSRLPSSIESSLGHIRYRLNAILSLPWRFDIKKKIDLTVVSEYDLNLDTYASAPVEESYSHFTSLLTIRPDVISRLSMPVRGYNPGQNIPIDIFIENVTGVNIHNGRLRLNQVVGFKVRHPYADKKEEKTVIRELIIDEIKDDICIFNGVFDLPQVLPSNTSDCDIIDVQYEVELKLHLGGFTKRDLKFSTPVFIGTVPFSEFHIFPKRPFSPPPEYNILMSHDLSPPTYEEALLNGVNL